MMNQLSKTTFGFIICLVCQITIASNKPKLPSDFKQQDNFAFEENNGQLNGFDGTKHPEVKFSIKSGNTQIFLLEDGIAYQFTRTHYPKEYEELMHIKPEPKGFEKLQELQKQVRIETFRMDMKLVGANKQAKVTAEGRSTDHTNYYNHNVLNVHSFSKITYHNIYPGIDWVIYISGKEMKYDFIVKPGADPSQIKIQFKHQEDAILNKDGSFTIKNILGSITEKAPYSYQARQLVNSSFVYKKQTLYFNLDNYDKSKILVIDPNVVWTTYYGGPNTDDGKSCCTDAFGNVYLAGQTQSNSNIASGGYQNTYGGGQDAFLVKFNSSGVRQWATYYGGGAGNDYGLSCCSDASGNVYLAGSTVSSTNIASGGHQNTYGGVQDAFLVKFNNSGVRQWATYYGGINPEFGNSCCTDGSGNVYLAGETRSNSNIASSGHQNTYGGGFNDAFMVKFNSSGVQLWGTYYGGTLDEYGNSCSTDASGNVYLAGETQSSSNVASSGHQTTLGGGQDAFLVKFNNSGVRQWATYYGGTSYEYARSCCTDGAGNVYLAGDTQSSNDIASSGHQNSVASIGFYDAFLVKFNSAGVRQWGTYYGGTLNEFGFSCCTDGLGNVFLAGTTRSSSNIAVGGYQNSLSGVNDDAFLVKFNSIGVRQWGTYFGNNNDDSGSECCIDASNNIYLTGQTLSGALAQFGHQNISGGSEDAFLVKFCDSPNQPSVVSGGSVVCVGTNQTYSVVNDPLSTSYVWGIPSGWSGTSSSNTISLTAGSSGIFSLTANNSCGTSLTRTLNVTVNSNPTIAVNSGSICAGQTFTISPSGANTYTIQGGSNTVSPAANSTYTVIGTNSVGCVSSNLAICGVTVNPNPTVTVNSGSICSGQSFTVIPSGANIYTIQGGNYTVSPTTSTSYTIRGANQIGCLSQNTATSNILVYANPTITINSGSICVGQSFTMAPAGAASYSFSSGASIVSPPASTSFSVIGTSSLGCISASPAISNVTANPLPFISVNSGVICSGQNFTISPSGANAYTIQGGNNIISPTANTTYTVRGISSLGCLSQNTATSSVTVNVNPSITVNSGSICSGNTFTINPSGASTYTYSSGSASVNPTITTSYSVTGTSSVGCISSNTVVSTVSVAPSPTISVNSGSICAGNSFVIVPNGASTYTMSGGTATVSPNTTSNYSVIGTDSFGCVSGNTAISTVTVINLPAITVSSSSSVICSGETATLTASGADQYSWSNGGSASASIVSPTISSTYTLTGTNLSGCFKTISTTQSVSACTEIQSLSATELLLRIYPNPTNGEFTIDTPSEIDVTIINALGQIIMQQHLNEGKNKIELKEHAKGIYFMKTKNSNFKILKE